MKYLLQGLKIIFLLLLVYSKVDNHRFLVGLIGLPFRFAELVTTFFMFFLGANLTVTTLSGLYRRKKKLKKGQINNVLTGLYNIYYILLAGAFVMVIPGILGIDYKTLFTSLSIVAAAIAIISKDYLSEIISGIIISFSSEINIGDYVKIGNQKGKILDITLTKVALLNDDDDIIFIPNNKVFSNEIVNYTKKQIKKVSIGFEVDLKFLRTVEELEKDLIGCLKDFHEHIETESFNLKVVEIKKDSLMLKFQYVLHQINRKLEQKIRRTTVRRVVDFINK